MRPLLVILGMLLPMMLWGLRADSRNSTLQKLALSEEHDHEGNLIVLRRTVISLTVQPKYSLTSYEETTYLGDARTRRKAWTRGMIELTDNRRRVFDMVTESFDSAGRLETRFTGSIENGEPTGTWEKWDSTGTLRKRCRQVQGVFEGPFSEWDAHGNVVDSSEFRSGTRVSTR